MNIIKTSSFFALIGLMALSQQACKSKKITAQRSAETETAQPAPPPPQQPAPVAERPAPAPVEEKPDFNFRNIQFEFDSSVLKTESYAVLDRISREIRKDPSARFVLNGHASVEGTADYNMSLSVDRANAVKLYLANAGIASDRLTAKGFGATQPTASNDTESGRALNRRVEIKLAR